MLSRVHCWLLVSCLLGTGCRLRFDEQFDARSGTPGEAGADAAGDPSAVKLVTKHIYGRPGDPFAITFTGGAVENLELRFIDSAHRVVHASSLSSTGVAVLPQLAGVYRVELRDGLTGGISHGQATVTAPVATFTSSQQVTLMAHGPYAPHWPLIPLVAIDVDGEGHPDLVRGASVSDTGTLGTAGTYAHRWGVGSPQLGPHAASVFPERRLCGFVMFDHDGDGDPDMIVVSERTDTYEIEICVLANENGTFPAEVCETQPGSMQDFHHCHAGVVAADFDRDGRVDLAIAGARASAASTYSGAELLVLANRPTGFVVAKTWRGSGTQVFGGLAVADVNDDGRIDILTNGGEPSRLHVFIAGDDFAFAEPTLSMSLHGDYYSDSITPGYIDGNPTLDIILSHADGPSTVFYSDGSALTPALIPLFTEQHGSRAIVFDPDINGELDVLIPYKNRFLQTNRMGGMRKSAGLLTSSVTPSAANSILGTLTTGSWAYVNFVLDDFNRDGRLDALFVAGFTYQIELLLGD